MQEDYAARVEGAWEFEITENVRFESIKWMLMDVRLHLSRVSFPLSGSLSFGNIEGWT